MDTGLGCGIIRREICCHSRGSLHKETIFSYKKLPSVDGTDGSEGMMGKVHNRKASESLRRPISFFKVPHAAIVDNMRTALQI